METSLKVLQVAGLQAAPHPGYILPSKNYLWGPPSNTVKLGDKERFDKEQIGVEEPFPVTNVTFA